MASASRRAARRAMATVDAAKMTPSGTVLNRTALFIVVRSGKAAPPNAPQIAARAGDNP